LLNPGLKSISIPTGIDIKNYKVTNPQNQKDICFIGALDWAPNQKGLIWFIKEVLPFLQKNNIKLHIAGRNAPRDFVSKLDIPSIVYHGEVDDAKKFISSFRILVVPLLTGSGIRIKILEGMALERCIITTSVGAEGLPVVDGEHLFITNEGKVFADKIIRLIEDGNLSERISGNARKLVSEKFDNFEIAGKLVDIYNNML
jgi:glycosyltransferase involved in cell wall biosynthesis